MSRRGAKGRGVTPGAARSRDAIPLSPPAAPTAAEGPARAAAFASVLALSAFAVTFHIFDTDFWQHLLVGKVIWTEHVVPTTQLWTWPTWGAPDVNASWGFRALIWPFWSLGGVTGLFVWRWLSTLAVVALLWAAARRMGASGFAPLFALALCVMVYRLRSQIRPETLVAILMAAQLWILETRRRGGPGRAPWLVAIALVWANAHISYYQGLLILAIYVADDLFAARGDAGRRARALRFALVLPAAVAVSFANPWGAAALAQPFEYFLLWRHEPVFQSIIELHPVDWRDYASTPLPLLVAGWPLLIVWRALRSRRAPGGPRGVDRVEIALCALFTVLALRTQRFIGFYAIVAAPFLMRDLAAWTAAQAWPLWTARPWVRGGAVIAACLTIATLDARRVDPATGIGIDYGRYPVKAADFMASHDVSGRGFNNFEGGGYQAWRFWPDRTRLPFMDVHQAGTREDRRDYAFAFASAEAWRALDRRRDFDYAVLDRRRMGGNPLLDVLDADSTWALVFCDDAAALYVRRRGRLAALAESTSYEWLPAGNARLNDLAARVASDSAVRHAVAAELERQAAGSPWNAGALSLLANVALVEDRLDDARALLERALAVEPELGRGHERLALIALAQGRSRDALADVGRARRQDPRRASLDVLEGRAHAQLGDSGRARAAYRRALRLDPAGTEARDSLKALEGAAPGAAGSGR